MYATTATDYQVTVLLVFAAVLAAAVLYGRFWCRYLCPAGAFLSLFNNVIILKKYIPVKWFGRCEYGLSIKDNMDCIYCDKCRFDEPIKLKEVQQKRPNVFLVLVTIVALIVSVVSLRRFLQVVPTGFGQAAVAMPAAGEPRDVDTEQVRKMIEQNQLSDKEAEYYKKVD
jgi:hypothetical protein